MASRDLLKRLEGLEAARARTAQLTPGQDAAFNALRSYQPGDRLTWTRFATDHPALSDEDKRLAYDAGWCVGEHIPELEGVTLDCPPWAVSQLESKVIPHE